MSLLIEILEEIEAAPRGNARLDVIAKHKDDYSLIRYFQKALSPAVTFGVKKIPLPLSPGKGSTFPFEVDLFNLALKLEMRELTGNKALQEIEDFLGYCSPVEEKWACRFLQQDLRLDVGAKAFNKAVGFNAIPLFGVPLAEDWNKLKKKPPTEGVWEIQPKLDGARTIAYIDFNTGLVELYSRTGKRWGNFKSVESMLMGWTEMVKQRLGLCNKWVLDGEVLSYVNGKIDFQALQHTMMRKDGVEDGELHYVVFGACTMEDWFAAERTYQDHFKGMSEMAGFRYSSKDALRSIDVLGYVGDCGPDGEQVQDFALLEQTLADKCQLAMSMGYEGIMLRRLDAPVELKRTKNLIKYKQFYDSEAKIVGVVEGNGKLAEMVGALVCETAGGQVFEIGTGLDDAERSKLWAMNLVGDLEGKWVSYKYQELTKDGIPRFPVYRGLRSADDFDKE